MPTYDYQCDACEHTFEEWQSFKDDALTQCPACKKNKLRRLFGGGAAIIFKGSGFYETDYRRKDEAKKNGKPAGEGKSDGDAKAEPKAEKSETTPAPEPSKPAEPNKAKPAKKSAD
jgi:putative FmdB family regulatory protein